MGKSAVWRHFKLDEHNSNIAICKICPTGCNDSRVCRNSNTSNLWTHLKRKHKPIYNKLLPNDEQNQSQLVVDQDTQILRLNSKKLSIESIDALIAGMIVDDIQPLSIVEDDGFGRLIDSAFPYYKIPGRRYFSQYIKRMHDEKKTRINQIIRAS